MRYGYDDRGRIDQTEHRYSAAGDREDDSPAFSAFGYAWDLNNNKTERHWWANGAYRSHTMSYDILDRMTVSVLPLATASQPSTHSYFFDGAGNRTGGNYSLDASAPPLDAQMNQYTSAQGDTVDRLYDARGSMTQSGQGAEMFYDGAGRLTTVIFGQDDYVAFEYDALGRRIAKQVVSSGADKTTRFYYDGARVVEERRADWTLEADFLYGNYVDEVLRMRRDLDGDGTLDGEYWLLYLNSATLFPTTIAVFYAR